MRDGLSELATTVSFCPASFASPALMPDSTTSWTPASSRTDTLPVAPNVGALFTHATSTTPCTGIPYSVAQSQ